MQLTEEIVYGFTGSLLSERFDNPKPTPQFHKDLWSYCCADAPLIAIASPREHGKSTAVTHAFVLASVLFRQADFVVIISDTETQAIQFLGDIKMEFFENEKLRQLFQVGKIYKDAEKEFVAEIGPDHHRFRILVRGASGGSGAVRGFKWRGKRPNLIICDDIENDEAVESEERRAKFREWVNGALIPSLADTGKFIIVGTVLHFDSFLERLMPQVNDKDTVEDGLMMYSTNKNKVWLAVKFKAHTDFDDFSEILWEEKFPEQRLRAIRQRFIDEGDTEGYSQEYLNYPIAEDSAFFRRTDFIPMDEDDFKRPHNWYAGIDLAISTDDKRAYTAIVVGGTDENGMLVIPEVIRRRMEIDEIIEELINLQIKYDRMGGMQMMAIEKGVLERAVGAVLKQEMLDRGVFINLWTQNPSKDKRSRARNIQARMRQGAVKFHKDADWYPAFEDELIKFDKGPYADQVDAIAWLGLMLLDMVDSYTEQEIADMEWDEEMHATISAYTGQSRITGY